LRLALASRKARANKKRSTKSGPETAQDEGGQS
jgi:hypothetical protein